jgi:hypothetical protein
VVEHSLEASTTLLPSPRCSQVLCRNRNKRTAYVASDEMITEFVGKEVISGENYRLAQKSSYFMHMVLFPFLTTVLPRGSMIVPTTIITPGDCRWGTAHSGSVPLPAHSSLLTIHSLLFHIYTAFISHLATTRGIKHTTYIKSGLYKSLRI